MADRWEERIARVRRILDVPPALVPDDVIARYLTEYRGYVGHAVDAIRRALAIPGGTDGR